jgi:hypothetical protein
MEGRKRRQERKKRRRGEERERKEGRGQRSEEEGNKNWAGWSIRRLEGEVSAGGRRRPDRIEDEGDTYEERQQERTSLSRSPVSGAPLLFG